MNESLNNPVGARGSVSEAIATSRRQPSLLWVMLVLAATVVVLVGIRLGAPILNPILFAVVLSLGVLWWTGDGTRSVLIGAICGAVAVLTVRAVSWYGRSGERFGDED